MERKKPVLNIVVGLSGSEVGAYCRGLGGYFLTGKVEIRNIVSHLKVGHDVTIVGPFSKDERVALIDDIRLYTDAIICGHILLKPAEMCMKTLVEKRGYDEFSARDLVFEEMWAWEPLQNAEGFNGITVANKEVGEWAEIWGDQWTDEFISFLEGPEIEEIVNYAAFNEPEKIALLKAAKYTDKSPYEAMVLAGGCEATISGDWHLSSLDISNAVFWAKKTPEEIDKSLNESILYYSGFSKLSDALRLINLYVQEEFSGNIYV